MRVWAIASLAVAGVVAAIYLVASEQSRAPVGEDTADRPNPNFWNPVRSDVRARPGPDASATAPGEAAREELGALGYLEGYQPGPVRRQITVHAPDRAARGYNLYVGGLRPSPRPSREIRLMDMEGAVVHTWRPRLSPRMTVTNWRRVELLEGGDLLLIVENEELLRLDATGRTRWRYPGRPHHDLDVARDGRIYVLTKRARRIPGRAHPGPVLDDAVCVLGAGGDEQRCVSVWDSIARSRWSESLSALDHKRGDLLHSNSLQVLEEPGPGLPDAFAPGRVLVTVRDLSALLVIDLEAGVATWMMTGPWRYPHSATLLPRGSLLLFDNNPAAEEIRSFVDPQHPAPDAVATAGDAGSRVLEIDPADGAILWHHVGTSERPFYSFVLGHAQRLGNGNTLITESVAGRAFEVTAEGEVVWEFVSPDTAGPNAELIAAIPEMRRFPPGIVDGWLDGARPAAAPDAR